MSRPTDLVLLLLDMEIDRLTAGGNPPLELGDDEAVVMLSELPGSTRAAFVDGVRMLRDLREREPLAFELLVPRMGALLTDFHQAVAEQRGGRPDAP